jgi:hypothetical protein
MKNINLNMLNFTNLLFFISLSTSAFCQTLDDFKTASETSEGPNLIPFYNLRRDATSIANEVQTRKAEAGQTQYNVWKTEKEKLLASTKKQKEIIQKETDFYSQFINQTPEAEGLKTCLDATVSKQKNIIAENDTKISAINDNLKKGMDIFERLYNARGGLREYFDDAIKELNDAKSSPNKYIGEAPSVGSEPTDDEKKKIEEYAQNKKKLEEYINTIIGKIQSQVQNHLAEENGSMARRKEFEELLKLNE